MPPWSERIQLAAVGVVAETFTMATFQVLLRNGWVERISTGGQQAPRSGLSAAGRALIQ